jgi:metallo-beta-lactamase family protein
VRATLALFGERTYHKRFEVADGLSVEFFDAGHILGSAIVVFSRDGRSIAFTGDLGNSPAPLIRDTEIPKQVQYLVMESVYGDREHEGRDERKEKLQSVITDTIVRGGALIIPAFSLERTQILLYEINELVEGGTIRPVPVFLDSPLAIKVTDIYKRHGDVFRQEVQRDIEGGDDIFNFPNLQFTPTHQESEAIAKTPNPKIIIAGAGMSHAGRIQIHEKLFLPDPLSTVLIVGYQSAGSLGRKLVERAKHVRIGGTDVRVRARVEVLTGYSAHPDVNGLVAFAEGNVTTLKQVFVTMGELRASNFLAQRLRDYVGLNALVPTLGKAYHVEV